MILASVPFVRGFPTAQKFDDETRAFQQEQASIDSAKAVIKIANSIELLRKDNAEFLIDFANIANISNVHADKAATSTVQSSQNLLRATAKFIVPIYISATLGAAADQSVLMQRSVQFYLSGEKEILQLVSDMPSAVKSGYEILIERLKEEDRLPTVPKRAPELGNRKPKDDEVEEDKSKPN